MVYTMKKRNKHIGSSLDDFLKEEGVLEEARAIALKDAVGVRAVWLRRRRRMLVR